jgi:Right handed beta helix region
VYLEGNDISGAWDNAIDYVGVQYGHVVGNKIHNAGDWCQYAKGGSAYLRIEGNTYTNCGTGGFTAGQGTGFQFMSSPWLHYEAYDIRFINNVVHNVEGAAIGAQGAFNVLFAHNTFYRIGSRSHVFEAVAGLRSCDGQPADTGRERCQQYLNAGGWGTTVVDNGSNAVRIPNRNVLVFNNIFYNPANAPSRWQQFQIFGALSNPDSSNVPLDARSDAGLIMRGNVIWNGPSNHPLGIEDGSACPVTHATCTPSLLVAQNSINSVEPLLVNAEAGDFRALSSGNVDQLTVYPIPNFAWSELPNAPAVPAGGVDNTVSTNHLGESRNVTSRVGAY